MVSKSATIMNSNLEYMTCDITLVGVGGEIWTDRNHKISGLIPPSCIMSCDITLDCEMWHHPWWGWEGWTDGGYSWQVVGVTVKPPTFTFFFFWDIFKVSPGFSQIISNKFWIQLFIPLLLWMSSWKSMLYLMNLPRTLFLAGSMFPVISSISACTGINFSFARVFILSRWVLAFPRLPLFRRLPVPPRNRLMSTSGCLTFRSIG